MKKYSRKLTIHCTAGYIDNVATPDCTTFLEISIGNSSGKVTVENKKTVPRSEHAFTINDATSLGINRKYNLTKEQATDIFLLSCSLIMPRYYLSLIQPDHFHSDMECIPNPSEVQINENSSEKNITIHCTAIGSIAISSCVSSKISIDEKKLFQIAETLLRYNIFNTQKRTLERNVIEAIKAFRNAFTTTEFSTCYLSMYSALEKAVNSNEERKGPEFDAEVSNLTGMEKDKIEKIRLFYNRLKHPLKKNSKDLRTLEEGQKEIGSLLRDLKEATGAAILAKIT